MEYRPFGRTGLRVSSLAVGGMMFGGRADQRETERIVDRALDAGINIFDTANVYGSGASEIATGVALARDGKRARCLVCTKAGFPTDESDVNAHGGSRRHLIEQCEASLRRLGTDYIDLYQIHRPHQGAAIDETLRALDDLVRSGKVRHIGSSNFPGWHHVEALWASRDLGLNRLVSDQSPYNILDRRIERELLPATRTFDSAVLIWGPLASGILTGKYRRSEKLPADSRFAHPIGVTSLTGETSTADENEPSAPMHPIYANRLSDRAYDAVERLEKLAAARGMPIADLALAWVLHQPGVTSALVGPRTLDQLDQALRGREVSLTAKDLAEIDAIVPPGTHVSPFSIYDTTPSNYRW